MQELPAASNPLNQMPAGEISQDALSNDKLKTCNERLSLANRILHDVNNLLMVIHFSSKQLLAALAADDLNRLAVIAIEEARKQAADLTNQFRDPDRIALQETRCVDLNGLILRSELLIQKIIRSNVVLTFNLANTPALINADPDHVDRIQLSLLLNALGRVPDGGWVTIETSYCETSEAECLIQNGSRPGRLVRLVVSDTGGEKAKHLEKNDSLIQKLVNQCGGQIRITTSADFGTSVEVIFPGPNAASCGPFPTGEICQNRARSETILLVDDEGSLRKLIRRALESQGFKVLEAHDGISAIATAIGYSGPCDLLLTDLSLPDMSGQEIAKQLQTL